MQGRLSPDGRFLVYAGNQKGNLDIWIKDLATGLPEPLASHPAADQMPSFSPDGRRVAFVSMREDVKGDVYILDLARKKDPPARITGRETADQYPVFAPDGKSIFLATGPEGSLHIERLWLDGGRREVLSDPEATQPAVSPDGSMLAYIHKDGNGFNTLAVLGLGDMKRAELPSRGIHAGFPVFSPDGKSVYIARFYYVRPGSPLTGDEPAGVWRLPVKGLFDNGGIKAAGEMVQTAGAGRTHLFPQATPGGMVYTTRERSNLDIAIEPLDGVLPERIDPADLLAMALARSETLDRLFLLGRLSRFPESPQYQEALYRMGQLYVRSGLFEHGRDAFEALSALPRPVGDWQGLARVDRAVWHCESARSTGAATGTDVTTADVAAATAELKRVAEGASASGVRAYALLREGDLLRMTGDDAGAMKLYREVVERYPGEREYALRARIRIGDLYRRLGDTDAQVAYYIRLLDEYPGEEKYQRDIVGAVLDTLRVGLATGTDGGRRHLDERLLERMRVLVEKNPDKPLLGAVLSYEMGRIYAGQDRYELAIASMKEVVRRFPRNDAESAQAVSALGDYALKLAADYRRAGRYAEASGVYGETLDLFERAAGKLPAGSVERSRAAGLFMSLALLKAGQEEADGDVPASEKTYKRILSFDPGCIPAWRRLIAFGAARGENGALSARFKAMIEKDPASFTAHYALGYLAEWTPDPGRGALEEAEKELRRAAALNPQSPYVHISLGWVAEMRERYLGETGSGLLEEAADEYDKAYRLNDRGADPQAEADILLNLGNVFALLGNTWNYAYEFYGRRRDLALPFPGKPQEALFEMNFGRAAYNMDRNDEAAAHLERALALARSASRKDIEADVVARLALINQIQGHHEISTGYFARAAGIYRANRQFSSLPALVRAMAMNDMALGNLQGAAAKLRESLELLDSHGTRDPGDFARLASGVPGGSLAPRGFGLTHEREVNVSLRAQIMEDLSRFRSAGELLDQKHALALQRRKEISERSSLDDSAGELARELAVLDTRRGAAAAAMGNTAAALGLFREAHLYEEGAQSKPAADNPEALKIASTERERSSLVPGGEGGGKVIVPTAVDLENQAKAAVTAADAAMRAAADGRTPDAEQLEELLARLETIQTRREILERGGDRALDPQTSWKLANALGTLGVEWAAARIGAHAAPEKDVRAGFLELNSLAERFSRGVRALKTVADESGPGSDESDATGALPGLRVRIHIESLLNLAELSSFAEENGGKAGPESRTSRILERALDLCRRASVPDLCPVVAMRLAAFNGLPGDAERAYAAYLDEPPMLYDRFALEGGAASRRAVFGPLLSAAVGAGDAAAAWSASETENRRAFAEALAASPIDAEGREIKQALHSMKSASAGTRAERESQSLDDSAETAAARLKRIAGLRKDYDAALSRLGELAPRLRDLFSSAPLKTDALMPLIKGGGAIVRLLPGGSRVHLLILDESGSRLQSLPFAEKRLRTGRAEDASAFAGALGAILAAYKTAYIDSSRVDPFIPLETPDGQTGPVISRFASLSALAASFENRKLPGAPPLVALDGSRPKDGETAGMDRLKTGGAELVEFSAKDEPALLSRIPRGQNLYTDTPLRYEGGSWTNWWIGTGPSGTPQGGYPFTMRIDASWAAGWAWFGVLDAGAPHGGAWMCLERLLVNLGLSSLAFTAPGGERPSVDALLRFAGGVKASPPAVVLGSLPGRQFAAGFTGLDAGAAVEHAKSSLLPTIQLAIGFQQKGAVRSAVDAYERALAFMDASGDYKYLDKVLEMLVDQTYLAGDYVRSIEVQKRVLERAEARPGSDAGRAAAVAKAKTALARNFAQAARIDDALQVNMELIEACRSEAGNMCAASARGQRGSILENGSRYAESLASYVESYKLYRKDGDMPGQLQQARNAARILRLRLSDYRRANEYLQRALVLADSRRDDPVPAMLLRLELARNAFSLGRYSTTLELARALEGSSRAEAEIISARERSITAAAGLKEEDRKKRLDALKIQREQMGSINLQARVEIVNTLWQQERFAEALREQAEAAAAAEKAGDNAKKIILNNALALIYAGLGDLDRAVETLNGTLAMAKSTGDRGEQASAYNNLGDTYRKAGRLAEARAAFTSAMEIDEQQKFKLGLAYDYANLGLVCEDMGRPADAAEYAIRARALAREIGNPANEVKAGLSLGRIHLSENRLDEAETALNEGMERVRALGLSEWEWKYNLQLGRLYVRRGRTEEGLKSFMRGIEAVEPLPPVHRKSLPRKGSEEERRELYDEALTVLADAGRAEDAFLLSERWRGRAFLDFAGTPDLRFANPEAAVLIRESGEASASLREARDALAAAEEKGDDARSAAVKKAKARYDDSLARLGALDRQLVSYMRVDTAPLPDLKALVPRGSALVDYHAAPGRLIIWVLTDSGLTMKSARTDRGILAEKVSRYRDAVLHFGETAGHEAELYGLLIRPVAAEIEGRERLFIVPSGCLHSVPFAALRENESGAYLGERRELRYLSNANSLRFAGKTRLSNGAVVAAGPAAGEDGDGALPFTRRELLSIEHSFPGSTILLGRAATEGEVKRLAANADLLHFAGHSELSRADPFESYIRLGASDGEDGRLHLSEIMGIGLKAGLVVLSSCESAIGPPGDGDEVVGLSRAFLTAGAGEVLASQWRVSDLASAVLMKHFYRLLKIIPAAAALKAAQGEVRVLFPHPAYWAGFRLEGTGGEMK
jgi:CHAT domain-containing protein/Tfp pilus assembly protein PilF